MTGSKTQILVIDADEKKADEAGFPISTEILTLLNTAGTIVKTPNGRHFYFSYDGPQIKTVAGVKWNGVLQPFLDVRAEGGCILAPPSSYKVSGSVRSYVPLKGDLTTLTPLPDEIAAAIRNDTEPLSVAPLHTETSDDCVKELLTALKPERWDTRDDWLKIGIILFNCDQPLDLWNAFSAKSKKWTPSCCADAWRTFQKGALSIASLWRMVKQDAPDVFVTLQNKYKKREYEIQPTHACVAEIFSAERPDEYRYCPAFGWWKRMPNCVWRFTKAEPPELITDIKNVLIPLCHERAAVLRNAIGNTDDIREKDSLNEMMLLAIKTGTAVQNTGFLKSVQTQLASTFLDMDFFTLLDSKRHLFAFTNGVYDLDRGVFRDTEPEDYISTTCGYAYGPSDQATREMILKTLLEIYDTEELRDYVLRKMAYLLHGHKKFQELDIWTGMGSNGKSVLINLLTNTFGEYCKNIPTTYFTEYQKEKDGALPALSRCRAARVIWASEPEEQAKLQTGFLKQISGGDAIMARDLHSSSTSYIPQFGAIILVNNVPPLSRADFAIKRRLRVIPHPFQFLENPIAETHRLVNREIDTLSKSERWRSAFMDILLSTYAESVRDAKTLGAPQIVTQRCEEYMEDNNPVAAWLVENYDTKGIDVSHKITPSELCAEFNSGRRDKVTPQRFGTLMATLGHYTRKSHGKLYYVGILKKQEDLMT